MKFFQNSNKTSLLYFSIMSLFILLIGWASFFEIDKSINVTGELSPLGRSIVIQNRFDGTIADIDIKLGSFVEEGEVLVKFETEEDASALEENRLQIANLKVALRRLNAMLSFEKEFEAQEGDNPEIYFDQLRIFNSEMSAFEQQILLFEAEKDLKLMQQTAAKSELNQLSQKFQLADKRLSMITVLFEKGFEGQISFMEAKQGVSSVQQEIILKSAQVSQLASEMKILSQKIKSHRIDFEKTISASLIETKQELQLAVVRNESYEAKLGEYSISAPVAGLISKLAITNVGEIASAGTTLMEIIPKGQPIVFYAEVPVDAVVDVEVGQLAKVTLSTMDTRYEEPIEGKIIDVDPDATTKEDGSKHFGATIEFPEEILQGDIDILPGVSGIASLIAGKRSVLEYFLEPIFQALRGSLSEA